MKRHLPLAIALALSAMAPTAMAATTLYKFDVTVTSPAGSPFSAPLFEIFNLSDPGVTITKSRIFNGHPWDYVRLNSIVDPTGGARTLLEGEERTNDGNNGCTAGITYGLTSFDPGDSFRFSADPESGGAPACASAVVDIRNTLNNDTLKVTIDFSGGVSLTGNNWVLESINPNVSQSEPTNQRYRLGMETSITTIDPNPGAVPEPSTWAMMILGFGAAGAMLRSKVRQTA